MERRFDSNTLWLILGVAGAALAPLAVACAKGDNTTEQLTLEADASSSADATSGSCGSSCAAGQKCSNGVCVEVEVDSDSDGVSAKTDCDDNDPSIHPGAPEVCNEKDDDCNGLVDDGVDKDKDGFFACKQGDLPVDCDDGDPAIHPKANEICNGKDDDCNGKTDEIPTTLSPPLTDSHWKLVGSAALLNDWAQLTSDTTDQVGALFWDANYTFDSFDVSATFTVQNKTDAADGIAFAWLQGTKLATGTAGKGFGVGGLSGYAVAVDTYTNNEDYYYAPFLAVVNAKTNERLEEKKLQPAVLDGNDHTLRVVLKAGKVTVYVDAVEQIKDLAINGYAPFAGHWGFTASTGAFSGTHSVRGVTMKFPDGQGCVP